ncbi:tetratricopeptide repeat protein, partial [Candidatus Omnitrophota bacterium]
DGTAPEDEAKKAHDDIQKEIREYTYAQKLYKVSGGVEELSNDLLYRIAAIYDKHSNVLIKQKEYEQAEDVLFAAYEIYGLLDDKAQAAEILKKVRDLVVNTQGKTFETRWGSIVVRNRWVPRLRELLQEGKIVKAERIAQRALTIDPNNPDIYFILAQIKEEQGLIEEAIEYFEQGIRKDEDALYVLPATSLIKIYIARGETEKALSIAQKYKLIPMVDGLYRSVSAIERELLPDDKETTIEQTLKELEKEMTSLYSLFPDVKEFDIEPLNNEIKELEIELSYLGQEQEDLQALLRESGARGEISADLDALRRKLEEVNRSSTEKSQRHERLKVQREKITSIMGNLAGYEGQQSDLMGLRSALKDEDILPLFVRLTAKIRDFIKHGDLESARGLMGFLTGVRTIRSVDESSEEILLFDLMRVDLYHRIGKKEQAADILRGIETFMETDSSFFPGNNVLLELGAMHEVMGDPIAAMKAYERILNEDMGHQAALNALLDILIKAQEFDFDKVVSLLERAEDVNVSPQKMKTLLNVLIGKLQDSKIDEEVSEKLVQRIITVVAQQSSNAEHINVLIDLFIDKIDQIVEGLFLNENLKDQQKQNSLIYITSALAVMEEGTDIPQTIEDVIDRLSADPKNKEFRDALSVLDVFIRLNKSEESFSRRDVKDAVTISKDTKNDPILIQNALVAQFRMALRMNKYDVALDILSELKEEYASFIDEHSNYFADQLKFIIEQGNETMQDATLVARATWALFDFKGEESTEELLEQFDWLALYFAQDGDFSRARDCYAGIAARANEKRDQEEFEVWHKTAIKELFDLSDLYNTELSPSERIEELEKIMQAYPGMLNEEITTLLNDIIDSEGEQIKEHKELLSQKEAELKTVNKKIASLEKPIRKIDKRLTELKGELEKTKSKNKIKRINQSIGSLEGQRVEAEKDIRDQLRVYTTQRKTLQDEIKELKAENISNTRHTASLNLLLGHHYYLQNKQGQARQHYKAAKADNYVAFLDAMEKLDGDNSLVALFKENDNQEEFFLFLRGIPADDPLQVEEKITSVVIKRAREFIAKRSYGDEEIGVVVRGLDVLMEIYPQSKSLYKVYLEVLEKANVQRYVGNLDEGAVTYNFSTRGHRIETLVSLLKMDALDSADRNKLLREFKVFTQIEKDSDAWRKGKALDLSITYKDGLSPEKRERYEDTVRAEVVRSQEVAYNAVVRLLKSLAHDAQKPEIFTQFIIPMLKLLSHDERLSVVKTISRDSEVITLEIQEELDKLIPKETPSIKAAYKFDTQEGFLDMVFNDDQIELSDTTEENIRAFYRAHPELSIIQLAEDINLLVTMDGVSEVEAKRFRTAALKKIKKVGGFQGDLYADRFREPFPSTQKGATGTEGFLNDGGTDAQRNQLLEAAFKEDKVAVLYSNYTDQPDVRGIDTADTSKIGFTAEELKEYQSFVAAALAALNELVSPDSQIGTDERPLRFVVVDGLDYSGHYGSLQSKGVDSIYIPLGIFMGIMGIMESKDDESEAEKEAKRKDAENLLRTYITHEYAALQMRKNLPSDITKDELTESLDAIHAKVVVDQNEDPEHRQHRRRIWEMFFSYYTGNYITQLIASRDLVPNATRADDRMRNEFLCTMIFSRILRTLDESGLEETEKQEKLMLLANVLNPFARQRIDTTDVVGLFLDSDYDYSNIGIAVDEALFKGDLDLETQNKLLLDELARDYGIKIVYYDSKGVRNLEDLDEKIREDLKGCKHKAIMSEVEVASSIDGVFVLYVDSDEVQKGLTLDTVVARYANRLHNAEDGILTVQDSLNISRSMTAIVDEGVKSQMRAAEFKFAT